VDINYYYFEDENPESYFSGYFLKNYCNLIEDSQYNWTIKIEIGYKSISF